MKKTLLNIISAFVLLVAPVTLFSPMVLASTASDAICEGTLDVNSTDASCSDTTSSDSVSRIVRTAIRIFQTIIGIIALVSVISAGLAYITSGGDSAKLKTARERLLYAVIGIIIVALAETIVQFAINRAINSSSSDPTKV